MHEVRNARLRTVRAFGKIHTIREMTEKRSTDFTIKLRKLFRIVFDTPEDFFELAQKPTAQTGSLVVPQGGCLDIEI